MEDVWYHKTWIHMKLEHISTHIASLKMATHLPTYTKASLRKNICIICKFYYNFSKDASMTIVIDYAIAGHLTYDITGFEPIAIQFLETYNDLTWNNQFATRLMLFTLQRLNASSLLQLQSWPSWHIATHLIKIFSCAYISMIFHKIRLFLLLCIQ